eukprot:42546-Pleurochrysis_carterae.AAC.5
MMSQPISLHACLGRASALTAVDSQAMYANSPPHTMAVWPFELPAILQGVRLLSKVSSCMTSYY